MVRLPRAAFALLSTTAISLALVACEALLGVDALTDRGGTDSAVSDATAPDEGESDSTVQEGGTADGRYCALLMPQPVFCADFDESSGIELGDKDFQWTEADDAGTLSIVSD